MAPWLTDFVLAELQSSSRRQEIQNPCSLFASSPPPQLVQILVRGGDWWTDPIDRNKDAWVILSDGKYCVKSVLTPSAKQHVLEEQSTTRNNNSLYRFYNYSRGSCALIRDYILKIQKSVVTGTTSILLSVGSMESKPGFHLPAADGQRNRVQQSLEDDINIRYAIQAWNENQEAQNQHGQQQQQPRGEEGEENGRNSSRIAPGNIVRVGNKRRRTVPLGDVMADVVKNPKAYEEILRLAKEEERKESDQGNDVYHGESQDSGGGSDVDPATQPLLETQPPNQDLHDSISDQGQDPATPDSQSRMYIQNVLMSQEEDDTTDVLTPKPRKSNSQHIRPPDSPLNNKQRATTTWDFVKEQLGDPKCNVIVFHTLNMTEKTVRRSMGSPAPNSGPYLCQYGLARWLHHNLKRK
jgi:hypothetical protein